MAGMVARHVVVRAFLGLDDGPHRLACDVAARRAGALPGYKVNVANPIRMRTITASAYLISRVNPSHA